MSVATHILQGGTPTNLENNMSELLSMTSVNVLISILLVINVLYLSKYIKLRIEEKKDRSDSLIRENQRLREQISKMQKIEVAYDPDNLISEEQNTFISQHLRDVDAKDFIKNFGFQAYVSTMIRTFQILNRNTRSITWIKVGKDEYRLGNSDKLINDAASPSQQ